MTDIDELDRINNAGDRYGHITPGVVAELIAEVRRLREDAERFQWLRDRTRGICNYEHTDNVLMRHGRFQFPTVEPISDVMRGSVAQHLEDAIDAARAKEKS